MGQAQAVPQWQAHTPVSEQGHDHWPGGVFKAAQAAVGTYLQGIGYLVQRREQQQIGGQLNDVPVVGIDMGDPASCQDQRRCRCHAHHRGDTECHLHRMSQPPLVVASPGMAHSHGGRQGKAERYHENQRGEIQGDLVAGHDLGAQAANQQGNHGKDADFEKDR